MTTEVEDFLEHVGVKGMKWGVRKADKYDAKLAKKDKKWEAQMWSSKHIVQNYNEMAQRINKGPELKALNANPKYKQVNTRDHDSKLTQSYLREYEGIMATHATAVLRDRYGTSPSGKLEVRIDRSNPDRPHAKIVPVDVQHEQAPEIVFEIILDASSKFTSVKVVEEEMLQSEVLGADFISHYGVKGMKWGRRKRTQKEEKLRGRRMQASKKRRQLSDADVEKLVKRLENEKKLKSLVAEDLTPGRAVAKKIMSSSGQTVVTAVATGAGMYAVRAILQKKFDPREAAEYLKPKKK